LGRSDPTPELRYFRARHSRHASCSRRPEASVSMSWETLKFKGEIADWFYSAYLHPPRFHGMGKEYHSSC
jgi:hypothetical protein